MKTDRGSATVELVLLAPVLVVLALFVVYAGRGAEVNDAIGACHEFIVVLDDEECVSFIAER